MNIVPAVDTVLAQRGIAQACSDANWQPHKNGWRYPVYNKAGQRYQTDTGETVYRWKAADSHASPKYLWHPKKPELVKYYLLPGTIPAIQKAGGIAYLASGEPDVLTYRAVGIHNTFCWFDGETSIPDSLLDDLTQHLGVSMLKVYPDRDDTGMVTAARLYALLNDSAVTLTIQQLPGEHGSKHDINWLWIDSGFNTERFRLTLLDAPAIEAVDLELWSTKDDAPAQLKLTDRAEWDGTLPQDFVNAILRAVEAMPGFKRWGGDGWSNNFTCPVHAGDETASAGFNRDSMAFKCFACGSMNAKDFGEKVGIVLRDYLPKTERPVSLNGASASNGSAPVISLASLYEDSETVTQRLIDELDGKLIPDVEPMLFPFQTFHRFGGFAEIMWAGKLVYISGVSGGGKTSLGETFYEQMARGGMDSVWFGPEWSPDEMKIRSLQRAGGMSMNQFGHYRAWSHDTRNNVDPSTRRGQPLAAGAVKHNRDLLADMLKWQGRAYYLKQDERLNSVAAILETIEMIVTTKRAEGRKVQALFFDYLQRAPKAGNRGWDWSEQVVGQIKSVCERLQLFGFIFIQPTKGASKQTRDGEALTEASGQGISDQQANLYFTLTPGFDAERNKLPYIRASIVKNSLGRTGTLYLKWAAQNLCIVDAEADPNKFENEVTHWGDED